MTDFIVPRSFRSGFFFSRLTSILALLALITFPVLPPFSLFSPLVYSSDDPFLGPANWGGTGLMEIPTARIMKENTYRLGAGQVYPYRYYYGALGVLPGMEIDGRVTEIVGVKGFEDTSYGWYKDKAFDIKYRFLPETKFFPALAIGIMDPQGTRLYPSQYVVASKQIYPFDFTIGMGNGRFGKRPLPSSNETIKVEMFTDPKQWLKDSQVFWGVQFSPSEKFSLMVEYSPIKFEKQIYDPAQKMYFEKPVPSKFNFGFRWKPLKWAEIDATFQRGEQFGINLSTVFEIGQPLVPIYDAPYRESEADKGNPLETRLAKGLGASGFSNIRIKIIEDEIWIDAQNNKYFYVTKAVGVILRLVNEIVPGHIENIHVIINNNGIPLLELTTTRADIGDWFSEKLTTGEFVYLSKFNTTVTENPDTRTFHRDYFDYGIKPSLESYLNDPSGFFKYRFGLAAWGSYHPWKGSMILAQPEWYPLNNISSSAQPLMDPVRSDIVLYKEKSVTLARLMFDQVFKASDELYGRISAGYLELEYAGVYGEIATSIKDGRFFLGAGGSAVRKRDPDNVFRLSDESTQVYTTAFLNSRLNIPEFNLAFDVKAGRFLGGDVGARFGVSKFINGVTISAWYTVTDTSVFKDPSNKGYRDKGISITVPIRLFRDTDSKTTYSYVLSPWTRDVGQDVNQYETLFDFIGRNVKIFFDKDLKWMD